MVCCQKLLKACRKRCHSDTFYCAIVEHLLSAYAVIDAKVARGKQRTFIYHLQMQILMHVIALRYGRQVNLYKKLE